MATTSNKTHNNAGILSGRERTPGTRISAILFDLDNTLIPTRQADDLTAQKVRSVPHPSLVVRCLI